MDFIISVNYIIFGTFKQNKLENTLITRKDPIVLLGIHRSGTSLLGELLTDIGVFMGRKMNGHHEAWHFLENNKKILDIAHADWDLPLIFESLLESEVTSDAVLSYMREETTQKKMNRHFFGRTLAMKEKLSPSQKMWGWKDPRTSITFPLWYKIFPEARFIMLLRNGVDVANSMNVREQMKLRRISSRATSVRCQSLEQSFRVWEEYNEFFYRYKEVIPEERLLVLKYEDLLVRSEENLGRIARHIGLSDADGFIHQASSKVNPELANRFQKESHLNDFYKKVKTSRWIKEFDY